MKQYKDTPYFVTEDGRVFRDGNILKTFYSRNGYESLKFCIKNERQHKLVHRLVAELYCDKPEGKNVVHHIDGNTKNNHYANLEWTTQMGNIHKQEKPGVRNVCNCILYKDSEELGRFQSKLEASRFARDNYGASYSSLARYNKTKEFRIEEV